MNAEFKPINYSLSIAESLEMGLNIPITLNVENYSKVVVKNSKKEIIGYADDSLVADVLKKGGLVNGLIDGYSRMGADIHAFYIKF